MSIDSVRTAHIAAASVAASPQPTPQTAAVAAANPATGDQTGAAAPSGDNTAGDHHFSFHDVLDAINPLQHIPVISTLYRHLTGDTISNTARVIGDTIYGGPVGLVAGLIDAHMVNSNGKDMGDRVLAMVQGDPDAPATAAAQVASAAAATPADLTAGTPGTASGAIGVSALSAGARAPADISKSVTLSALPSKPPPSMMPRLPPAGSYGMAKAEPAPSQDARSQSQNTPYQANPYQANPYQAAQNRAMQNQGMQAQAAQMAAMSVPGTSTVAPSSLPSMGSPATAAALAEAAPITPQTVQLQGFVPPQASAPRTAPSPFGSHSGIAIDTSSQGIMAMRAHPHSQAQVPLQLPAGLLLPSTRATAPSVQSAGTAAPAGPGGLSSNDFATRMKLGLEKYQAMMHQQGAGSDADTQALSASMTAQPASLPGNALPAAAAVARP